MTPGLDATAALVAADVLAIALSTGPMHAQTMGECQAEAVPMLAHIEAMGWRITSAPEHPPDADVTFQVGNTADEPVSAQAAPAYIECPCCGKLWTAALAPNFQRATANIEQAAVRAALEGLRAEVAVMQEATFGSIWRGAALDLIDARLAALE